VFLKPVKDLRKVTWVNGFIGESNFEKARAIALVRGWIGEDECKTPEEMDSKMALSYNHSPNTIEPNGKLPITWGQIKDCLYQNYPNPFNPDTWIPYQLMEASHVNIYIYDVAGQLTRMLFLGEKEAGVYMDREKAAHWDGRNQQGELVAS